MIIKDLIKQLSKYDENLEVFCGDWCTGTNDHDCGQWVTLTPVDFKEIKVAPDDIHEGHLLTNLDNGLKDDKLENAKKALYIY
jgi:hypothetical protein|tara:strand:+ start:372 stop:620 length:249 start_codon:yes stop_codon:yes gene_type:complete